MHCAGSFTYWDTCSAIGRDQVPRTPPSTRAGGQDDGSLNKLPQMISLLMVCSPCQMVSLCSLRLCIMMLRFGDSCSAIGHDQEEMVMRRRADFSFHPTISLSAIFLEKHGHLPTHLQTTSERRAEYVSTI